MVVEASNGCCVDAINCATCEIMSTGCTVVAVAVAVAVAGWAGVDGAGETTVVGGCGEEVGGIVFGT